MKPKHDFVFILTMASIISIVVGFLLGAVFFPITLDSFYPDEQVNAVATELCRERFGEEFVYKSVNTRTAEVTCKQAEQEYVIKLIGVGE